MDLVTGWACDNGRRYAFAYDPATEVAAVDHGGAYRDVSVAGSWQPGSDLADLLAFDTLPNAWDYAAGCRSGAVPWTTEQLASDLLASGQLG
jgi:hypothetical protein